MRLIDRSSLTWGCLIVLVTMSASCSRNGTSPRTAESSQPATTQDAGAPSLPTTLTDVNLAAADMGGAVEQLSGNTYYMEKLQANYGPGLTGRRLIDGLTEPTWINPDEWSYGRDPPFPEDAVFSFYERMPALVGAVTVVAPAAKSAQDNFDYDTSTAPKDVEIWTSMDNVPEHFLKAAAAALETTPGEHTITFPAREARYVRLRVLNGASRRMLEIAEVRVLEAARDSYVPLFTRAPGARLWKGSPREGAQRGLDWLQQSAADWYTEQTCVGCHVQSQAIMGQQVALEKGYRVSMAALDKIEKRIRSLQTQAGSWTYSDEIANTVYSLMGLARADETLKRTTDPALFRGVDFLLKSPLAQASDGSFVEPGGGPIVQGKIINTANALIAFRWAAAHSKDPKYRQAAERALAWIASAEPETTQDEAIKIAALMRYGTPEHQQLAWSVVERLAGEQQADGGWKLSSEKDGSIPFATGEVLYAFKRAGVSVIAPNFKRGTEYLLRTQVGGSAPESGSWKAVPGNGPSTDYAPTMWAVIGLAGAYGVDPAGALRVTKQGSNAARNLEIVLDVSGSMKTALGASTRWDTALSVLKDVVGTLPDDLNVGLRVYGHRYPSKSSQTCTDTELVVPLAKLDRNRIVEAATALHPRGETPLIRSVEQTVGDLKRAGGGSVILITDGEESCHGDPKAAAAKIKASGVKVSLNIVGFTLTGKAVEKQLSTLAGSTGGRYYSAQDGAQLSRALKLAALQRLSYDVLDKTGRVITSGETSELSRELPAGQYQLRMNVLGQTLEQPATIVADETTSLALETEGNQVVLRQPRQGPSQ